MKQKVSIIDDDPVNLLLLKETLKGYFEVTTYHHPCTFLEHLEEVDTNLVITDLMMPGMDGVNMVSRIKTQRPDLPVIIVSASDEEEIIKEAYEMGIEAYYLKPLNMPLLTDRLIKRIHQ